MYLTGTTCHLSMREAKSFAAIVRPTNGKCILRRDPLGTVDLITLSPKPMYSGQVEFEERKNDLTA